jgi:hypothetical protein
MRWSYQALHLKDDWVDSLLINEHINSLKSFRNGTFHYQTSGSKHVQFFDSTEGRIEWAELIHSAFEEYFNNYRRNMVIENFSRKKRPAD